MNIYYLTVPTISVTLAKSLPLPFCAWATKPAMSTRSPNYSPWAWGAREHGREKPPLDNAGPFPRIREQRELSNCRTASQRQRKSESTQAEAVSSESHQINTNTKHFLNCVTALLNLCSETEKGFFLSFYKLGFQMRF